MRCVIDCREDKKLSNNYIRLSLWGKPCFAHVIDAATKAHCFTDIEVVTDDTRIRDYCEKNFPAVLLTDRLFCSDCEKTYFVLSGRAPCITSETIRDVSTVFDGRTLISTREASVFKFDEGEVSFYDHEEQRMLNAFMIFGGGMMEDKNYAFYPVKNQYYNQDN